MSVVGNAPFIRKSWRGYQDPALPIGAWQSTGTILGDPGGGSRVVNTNFRPGVVATTPLALWFSIESIHVFDNSGANNVGQVQSAGFEVNRSQSIQLLKNGGSDDAVLNMERWRRMFLGRGGPVGAIPQVQVAIINTDNELLTVTLEGYMWTGRSILADGGFQLPMGTPWRQ